MARSPKNRLRAGSPKKPSVRRARLFVELLEDRLTPSWTGVPPAVIAVPTNPVDVVLNSSGDATDTGAITANENDFYRFDTEVSGTYVLRATRDLSNIDTVIGIFDAAGNRVAFNDDISSTNTNSKVIVDLDANETYYFGVTNFRNTAGGRYTWKINGPDSPSAPTGDDGFEENDSFGTAANLGSVSTRRTINNLVMADGHDWFKFTTAASGSGGSVTISFTHALGDVDMELFTSGGTRVRLADGVTNSERISLDGLSAGTYFVHVYGYRGADNPNYSLDIVAPAASSPSPSPSPTPGGFNIELRITGMTASQVAIFESAAARWEEAIIGDLPNATFNGITVDDVLIDARGRAIDGVNGILGQAGPDRMRSGSFLPYHGSMEFDTADLNSLQQRGQLEAVIMHEMGHVLGVGTIWDNLGLLAGEGTSNPRFTGARAVAEYNAIFGRSASAVPVENSGGGGTRDSHWRETVFDNELMTGFLNSGRNPLSRITIASMADLGYVVDLSAADSYSAPAGAASLTTSTSSSSAALVAAQREVSFEAYWLSEPNRLGDLWTPGDFASGNTTRPRGHEHLTPTVVTQEKTETTSRCHDEFASDGTRENQAELDAFFAATEELPVDVI